MGMRHESKLDNCRNYAVWPLACQVHDGVHNMEDAKSEISI